VANVVVDDAISTRIAIAATFNNGFNIKVSPLDDYCVFFFMENKIPFKIYQKSALHFYVTRMELRGIQGSDAFAK
jgi:hypothetical protein